MKRHPRWLPRDISRRNEAMENRPLIIAVDDEETLLKLLRVNLTADGYDVLTASGGEEALELMKQHQPNLIVLDIMLPDLDGFQLLDIIREHSDVPIIVLTARAEEDIVNDVIQHGADDCVKKPFSILELAARIKAKRRRAEKGASLASPTRGDARTNLQDR
jgi:DNA-binding response OmpR family regulator